MPDDIDQDSADIDLAAALGAGDVSTQCFSIYVPNKDRTGKEIGDQRRWVLEAIRLLSEINGGATAMPPVEGGWLNDDGEIIWECPSLSIPLFVRTRSLEPLARFASFYTGWAERPARAKSPLSSMVTSTASGR